MPAHDIYADMPRATRVLNGVAFCDVDAWTIRRTGGQARDSVVAPDDLTGVWDLVDRLAIIAVAPFGEDVVAGESAGAVVWPHLRTLLSQLTGPGLPRIAFAGGAFSYVAAGTVRGFNKVMRVRLAPLPFGAVVPMINISAAEHTLEAKADETGATLKVFAAGVVLYKGAVVHAGVYAAGLSGAAVTGGLAGDVLTKV